MVLESNPKVSEPNPMVSDPSSVKSFMRDALSSAWNSETVKYLKQLLSTTIATVTPLGVAYIVLCHLHNHYSSKDGSISKESKELIKKTLKKWSLDPKQLGLNEHEWAIAMNLVDPESLEGVSWSDIAGSEEQIQRLKDLVVLPLKSKQKTIKRTISDTSFYTGLLQPPKGVLVHGPPGVGKSLLARILARATGCRLLTIDPSKMSDRHFGESEKLTTALFTLAEKLSPAIILIDEIDSVLKSRAANDNNTIISTTKGIFLSYWDRLGEGKTVIVLGTTNRPKDIDPGFLRRFDLNLELSLPNAQQRRVILELLLQEQKEAMGSDLLKSDALDDIAHDMSGFSGADIKETCRQAVILAMEESLKNCRPLQLLKKHFEKTVMELKQSRTSCGGYGGLDEYEMKIAGSLLSPDALDIKWEDVAGLDKIIDRIKKNVILPLVAIKNLDILKSGLIQPPKGILLHGEPGCGKTLLAKAIAKYVNCSFINLQPSDLQGNLYGDTCRNVRALFSLAAKYQPCIIFIDEIDALFRKRQNIDHEATNLLKTSFMALWDGIVSNSTKNPTNIIIMGATNRPESIDPAILRRLPEKIHIPLPDLTQREQILKTILKHEKLADDVDLSLLAKSLAGLSGSDLKEICRNAAINAIHSSTNKNQKGMSFSEYQFRQPATPRNRSGSRGSPGAGDIRRLSRDRRIPSPRVLVSSEGLTTIPKIKKDMDITKGEYKSNVIRMVHFESARKEFLDSRVK